MVDHPLETAGHLLKGGLQVLAPVELRVIEPGAHHPLVAPADHVHIPRLGVAHPDEGREQAPAPSLPQGEAALVHLEGGDDDLLGEVQEFFLEGAGDREGPLHEVGHLLHQPLDHLGPGRELGPGLPGGRLHPLTHHRDPPAPRPVVHDRLDEIFAQFLEIVLKIFDFELFRCHESVTAGGVSRFRKDQFIA